MSRRALIVDDEPSIRTVLAGALRAAGWTVRELDDGALVEEALEDEHFDLIVLDLYMPGMSGYEVLRRVRRYRRELRPFWKTAADVRIIVLSGAAGEEGLSFARRIGADASVSKPFDLNDFLAAARG
jgi:CheY-like chemotaxis protein